MHCMIMKLTNKHPIIEYHTQLVFAMVYLLVSVVGSCKPTDCQVVTEFCDIPAQQCSLCSERPCDVGLHGKLTAEHACKRDCLAYYQLHFAKTVSISTPAPTVTSQEVQFTSTDDSATFIMWVVLLLVTLIIALLFATCVLLCLCNKEKLQSKIKKVLKRIGRCNRRNHHQPEEETVQVITIEVRQNNNNHARHKLCPTGSRASDEDCIPYPEQSAKLMNVTVV